MRLEPTKLSCASKPTRLQFFNPLHPSHLARRRPLPQEHWQRHKKPCKAHVIAAVAQAKLDRESKKAAEADKCVICLDALVDPIELPCKHSYCRGCVAELREKGVSQSCPLCRAPLPPGAEQLWDLGSRMLLRLDRVIGFEHRDRTDQLTSEQRSEMDGAILMLKEAMAQVCVAFGWAGRPGRGAVLQLLMQRVRSILCHTRLPCAGARHLTLHTIGPCEGSTWRRVHLLLGPRGSNRLLTGLCGVQSRCGGR